LDRECRRTIADSFPDAPVPLDQDGEIVHGVKLPIARTAPSVAIADRRSNIPARRGTGRVSVERFMMFSVVSFSIETNTGSVAFVSTGTFDVDRSVEAVNGGWGRRGHGQSAHARTPSRTSVNRHAGRQRNLRASDLYGFMRLPE
jgi:hypothetical protein